MFLKSMDFVALIGPYLQDIGMAAEALRVPYLCVNPVTAETRDFTLELMPRMEDIGKAIYDIAHAYGWKKISVFYDDDKGEFIVFIFSLNSCMVTSFFEDS